MDHGETQQIVEGILQPYLELINGTPELLSLLYDVNLLPEQCTTVNAAVAVQTACVAYRLGQQWEPLRRED
jgi:hypothetical protein